MADREERDLTQRVSAAHSSPLSILAISCTAVSTVTFDLPTTALTWSQSQVTGYLQGF